LTNDMEKGGYTKPATALALTGLKRKNLVEAREISDRNGDTYNAWFVTESGEEWLVENQHTLNLGLPPAQGDAHGPEISDEDIPF